MCARCEAWPERSVLDALHARRVHADDDAAVGSFVKPSFFSVWMWCDRSRTPGVAREAIEGNDSKIFPRRVVKESLKTTRGAWGFRGLVGFPTQRSGGGDFRVLEDANSSKALRVPRVCQGFYFFLLFA